MSETPLVTLPITQCTSLDAATAGMNCNGTFSKKNHPGLCAGCILLKGAPDEKLAEIMDYPQCIDCGTKYRFMKAQPDGQFICGPCAALSNIPHQSPANSQQQADRTARMDKLALLQVQNRGGPPNANTSQASTPRRPFINVDLFIGGRSGKAKAQCVIGNMGYQFESDDLMEERVIAHFLQAAAPAWEARHTNSLQLPDVRLRLNNNVNLHCDQDVTVREFIQTHLDVPAAHVIPASHKSAARKYGVFPAVMYLELHVQADLYASRTGEAVQIGTALTATKRKLDVDDGQLSKRSRIIAPIAFVSTFQPRADHAEPPARTEVQMSMIATSCDVNGKVDLDDSTLRSLPSPSFIHDKQLACGKMKFATLDELFVVKRFFQVSVDAAPVSLEENKTFLTQELLLTGEVKFFLTKFYECGTTNNVDFDASLTVTDAWLATESVSEEGTPCPAAGLFKEDINTVRTAGITWLVEPLRAGSVQKFSGTLNRNYQPPTSRLAATVDAFIHFVYYYSQQTLVLCDIQTMKARINGQQKNVIFDPMAHTPKGKSGPGDHGQEGIKNFISTHHCSAKCEGLGLEGLEELEDENDDE
ncbi:kinase-like domain-containing protein [Mycena galopus ATCC 62051]|nr:kinase-like domain-containing protein [Mycena galopus ATCC 62051]